MFLQVAILVLYTSSLHNFLLSLLMFWRISPVIWFCPSCIDFVIHKGFFFVCDSSIHVMFYYYGPSYGTANFLIIPGFLINIQSPGLQLICFLLEFSLRLLFAIAFCFLSLIAFQSIPLLIGMKNMSLPNSLGECPCVAWKAHQITQAAFNKYSAKRSNNLSPSSGILTLATSNVTIQSCNTSCILSRITFACGFHGRLFFFVRSMFLQS